ncbi:phosphate acyltransferase [Oleispirillum naphthae]|uniref:phosphate acyltransferase n=1 Tax=Oleispirillum naphthae TaxID=2838853 RepID=UPI0030823904
MIYSSFNQLVTKVRDDAGRRKVVAVVAADDSHTLEAATRASRDGILTTRLIGPKKKIRELLSALDEDPASYEIIAAEDPVGAAHVAAGLVRDREVDFVMKGKIQTADLLRAMLAPESGVRTGRMLSHLAIAEIPNHHKLIGITDVAITIAPNLDQKREIIENAAAALAGMGFDPPKVALLSASETINPKMIETVEAAELAKSNREGWLSECIVEGPLSYDLAMSREAAEIKGIASRVCGDADLLVVPHITVGNVLLKALRYSAGALSAGIVVGGRVPIVLTSRAVETRDKFLPLVLAASMSAESS